MSLKNLFGATDMTVGKPAGKIVAFTIPMLIGNIAQQLYGTVDSIVVGRYVGDNALAAVGSASPVFSLLLVLFAGVATGSGIMVSQYYGAKDRENLSKTIGVSLSLILIVSVMISVSAIFVTKPMLRLLNTPESIIDWCAEYLYILFYGVIGLSFYNLLSGILRGLGDSFSALLYLLIACILNIGLDIFFVASLGLGVAGVALATVIAQVISAVLSMMKLMRMKDVFDTGLRYCKLEKKMSWNVIRLGLPSGITQAIFSMAMLLVQSLTNSFGEAVIAANVIVMRVDGFAMMPNFSFGVAMTTFAGQNVGAGKLDRVKKGARDGTVIATIITAVLTLAILLFGRYLMRIFTETESLVTLAMKMMTILAVGYISMSVTQCLSGVMRGAGDTMTPMWISLITTVVVRVPIAYALAYLSRTEENPIGDPMCIFISLLISWLIGALITIIAYRRGKWKKTSLIKTEA